MIEGELQIAVKDSEILTEDTPFVTVAPSPPKQNFCQIPGHQKNKVNYFCLDDICHSHRLFCHVCARLNHKKHRIGRIDRLIEPLSLLNINSLFDHSHETYEHLRQKMDQFYEVIFCLDYMMCFERTSVQKLNEIQSSFDSMIKSIEMTTFFQLKCLLETFSQEKIEEIESIFQEPEPDAQKVKQAIEMINFLQFEGVEDSDTVKKVCEATIQKMTKTVEKAHVKLEIIFEKISKNIKENDFISELKRYKAILSVDANKNMNACHPSLQTKAEHLYNQTEKEIHNGIKTEADKMFDHVSQEQETLRKKTVSSSEKIKNKPSKEESTLEKPKGLSSQTQSNGSKLTKNIILRKQD